MRGPLIFAVLFSALGVIGTGPERKRSLVLLAVSSSALMISAVVPGRRGSSERGRSEDEAAHGSRP